MTEKLRDGMSHGDAKGAVPAKFFCPSRTSRDRRRRKGLRPVLRRTKEKE
jgi:hypothetical protein